MWNWCDRGNGDRNAVLIWSRENDNPDHAAMAIIEMAWTALRVSKTHSFVGLTASQHENSGGHLWSLDRWRILQSDV